VVGKGALTWRPVPGTGCTGERGFEPSLAGRYKSSPSQRSSIEPWFYYGIQLIAQPRAAAILALGLDNVMND